MNSTNNLLLISTLALSFLRSLFVFSSFIVRLFFVHRSSFLRLSFVFSSNKPQIPNTSPTLHFFTIHCPFKKLLTLNYLYTFSIIIVQDSPANSPHLLLIITYPRASHCLSCYDILRHNLSHTYLQAFTNIFYIEITLFFAN